MMSDISASKATGSLDVGQLTSNSHPKWWMQDIKNMQVHCTFNIDAPRSFKRDTCKNIVQVLDKAMRGIVPVRVAPDLNAGFSDAGRVTLFFNVREESAGANTILASSLIVFRHDLVDLVTTGFYVPPQISLLSANPSGEELKQALSTSFTQLFLQI